MNKLYTNYVHISTPVTFAMWSLVTGHRVFSTNQKLDEFSLVIIMDIYSTYISFRPSDRVEEQGYSLVTTQHDHCHGSRLGYPLLDHRIRPLVFLKILTSQFDWTTSRVITRSFQINKSMKLNHIIVFRRYFSLYMQLAHNVIAVSFISWSWPWQSSMSYALSDPFIA